MAGIGEAASVIAVLQITANIAKVCGGYLSNVHQAQQEIESVREKVAALHSVVDKLYSMVEEAKPGTLPVSSSVLQSLEQCRLDLEILRKNLDPGKGPKVMKQIGLRALKWPFSSKQVDKTVHMLEGYIQIFTSGLQIDHVSMTFNHGLKLENAEQDRHLAKVPCVESAAFNSYERQHEATCLADTRVDLLQFVANWADGLSTECIFWLNGMAGTGKSTIARTVAQSLHKRGRLAASFFFSRGRGDLGRARKFFSTIAFQIATMFPVGSKYISAAVAEQPNIALQAMFEQYDKLIIQPLQKMRDNSSQSLPLTIVVDALDECSSQEDVRLILRLFAATKDMNALNLRIFLTSRPETPILLGFRDMPGILHRDLALHHVPRLIVEEDIYKFLKHEFERIRVERNQDHNWPGEPRIRRLVKEADCLFIFAATACRFINGPRGTSPEKRLSRLLEGQAHNLDEMYTIILQNSITGDYLDDEKEEAAERFKQIVGSIAVLFDLLSVDDLGVLLIGPKADSARIVREALDSLHSVLDVAEDQNSPIRLLHHSFRDFLLDKRRCIDVHFWIDERLVHDNLVGRCLKDMTNHLRKNICRLPSPGFLSKDIPSDDIALYLPAHFQYACQHWVGHAKRGQFSLQDNGIVHKFLQEHFLHWLEVLSVIGRTADSISMVAELESMLSSESAIALQSLLHDARRFILTYRFILEKAPLQLYSSATVFSPRQTIIRKLFFDEKPGWLNVSHLVDEQWGPCLQTLEGHSGSVNAVVLSLDGQLVASGSRDGTVRLWGARTGECRGRLEGHSGGISGVVFLEDGQLVASGSDDGKVRIWDVKTGKCRSTLEGHLGAVRTVVFSREGLIASGSDDETVRLWDVVSGECRGIFKGHLEAIRSVTFSPDGQLLASGSGDGIVRLWDARTGECLAVLKGHSGWVNSVIFSWDGGMVVSGSDDETVRIWDTKAGECCGTLKGHSGSVRTVVLSREGQLVASGSEDGTVRLWDVRTGECRGTLESHAGAVRTVIFSQNGLLAFGSDKGTVRLWDTKTMKWRGIFEGHSGAVRSITFSQDNQLMVSGSYDNTVRLWEINEQEYRGTSDTHSGAVRAVVFSQNGQLVASGSNDHTVRVWNASTGECRGILEGHLGAVSMVVFSLDGQLIASGSSDGTVRLWDIKTRKTTQTIKRGPYDEVSFTSDGSLLNVGTKQVSTGAQPSEILSTELKRADSLYSLDDTGQWVLFKGTDVLWIPPDRRPGVSAVRDNMVVLGNGSGRMTFLSFEIGARISV